MEKVFKDAAGTKATTVAAETLADKGGHSCVKTAAVTPTCTQGGNNEYYTCSVCQKVFKDAAGKTATTVAAETLAAKGHSYVKTEAADPTCTEAGNSEYYTCSACGKYFKLEDGKYIGIDKDSWIIPADGHAYVKTNAVAQTCTEAGNSEYYTCSVCGKYFELDGEEYTEIAEDSWIIPADGHSLVKTEAADPTCTEDGNNEYYTCSVCERVFKEETAETETTVEAETITALGHDWGEWVETEAPAPGTAGTETRTCARDNSHTETRTTEALPYIILKGDKQTYVLKSGAEITLRCNGDFSRFTGLTVNGKTLDPACYTAREGSTIITLNNDYLDTLAVGTYPLAFVYDNGSADGTLYVVENNTPDIGNKTVADVVTGDNAPLGLWLALIGLSCAVLAVCAGTRKKHGKK